MHYLHEGCRCALAKCMMRSLISSNIIDFCSEQRRWVYVVGQSIALNAVDLGVAK